MFYTSSDLSPNFSVLNIYFKPSVYLVIIVEGRGLEFDYAWLDEERIVIGLLLIARESGL